MIQRNTIQRALVLDAVNTLRSHATAEDIYQFVRRSHPTISKATVYRNLRQLAEAGDIRILETPGGAERYDHIPLPHYHIKCRKCQRYFDVKMDYIEDLQKCIKDPEGFDVCSHDIIFQGICPECKNL